MIHKDKDNFVDTIYRLVKETGYPANLIEKDYYLSIILSRIKELSPDLIFKGGTCLNKVYYDYYRLSEDLDFSMKLPHYEAKRSERRACIQPVKENIDRFVQQFDLTIDPSENPGRNESKQYVYNLKYQSVLRPAEMSIKLEIGLRFNPIEKTVINPVRHKFFHAFTREPLFNSGEVHCLSLKEIVSEKLRAAATRKNIASRDFYDLDYIIRKGFNMADKSLLSLFLKKLKEDNCNQDLSAYRINLGRTEEEIKMMKSRLETELFDVLTIEERDNFDMNNALQRINDVMENALTLYNS